MNSLFLYLFVMYPTFKTYIYIYLQQPAIAKEPHQFITAAPIAPADSALASQATTLELPKNAERVMWRVQTHGPGYPTKRFEGTTGEEKVWLESAFVEMLFGL